MFQLAEDSHMYLGKVAKRNIEEVHPNALQGGPERPRASQMKSGTGGKGFRPAASVLVDAKGQSG